MQQRPDTPRATDPAGPLPSALPGGNEGDQPAFTAEETDAVTDVARFLEPNPRHPKRLVNVYRLVRSLAQIRHEASVLDDPGGTIRLLAIAAQWPYTLAAMLDVLDALAEREETGEGSFPKREPLDHLYRGAQRRVDARRQAELDQDLDDLKALPAQTKGRLSWKALVSLRRYIVNFKPAVEEELRAARTVAAERARGDAHPEGTGPGGAGRPANQTCGQPR